jgi:hypothetical protein
VSPDLNHARLNMIPDIVQNENETNQLESKNGNDEGQNRSEI